jgi:hypothetical protein
MEAERQVSGAAKSGNEARVDAVRRRLQTLVRHKVGGLSWRSQSLQEHGHAEFLGHAWAECHAETGLTRQV